MGKRRGRHNQGVSKEREIEWEKKWVRGRRRRVTHIISRESKVGQAEVCIVKRG